MELEGGRTRGQLNRVSCPRVTRFLYRGPLEGSEEILECHKAGIAVTLPKPMTSGVEARGRFGKQDFVYLDDEDVYRCPAGEKLTYHYTNEENGQKLRRYWLSLEY